MFGKFKDKLKKSLSIFSRKAEEEAEQVDVPAEEGVEEPVEEEAPEPEAEKQPEPTPEPKPIKEPTPSADDLLKEVEEEAPEPKPVVEEKSEPVKELEPIVEEKEPEPVKEEPQPVEEKPAEVKEEPKVEKKSFIKRMFTKREQPEEEKTKQEESIEQPPTEQPKKGIFTKAKEVVTTKKLSEKKFEELFWDLEVALLENNVAVDVITKLKDDLKQELLDKPLPRNLEAVVQNTLKESLNSILSLETEDILTQAKEKKPLVIAFFGINGSGKTTTIAKLAHLLKDQGLTCVMAAGDTFRAAAIDQLQAHADKLNIKLIKHDYGSDAAAVAFDSVRYAENNDIDVVLIDTAGRLHSDTNLMDELKKIVKVSNPDIKLFVGESITGNDCIEQSQKFNEHIGIDGIILTKADVDDKGGTALSISYVTKKPIFYIGIGQTYKDLKPFTKELVMENLGLA